jgi:hypothetical protein
MISEQFRSTLDRSKPAVEFKFFPYLPKELRVKIWKFGVPGPRAIHLNYSTKAQHMVCRQPLPAVLHTCHESRTETLSQFKTVFDPYAPAPSASIPTIYINPNVDTYYFRYMASHISPAGGFESDFNILHRTTSHPVKRLALNHILFKELILENLFRGRRTLLQYRDLEALIIAIAPYEVEPE